MILVDALAMGLGRAVASIAADSPAMWAGWVAALAACVVAGGLNVRLVRRAALVAEAAHELRGPLTAAGLALHGAGGDPRRLAAAELELRRAGLALEDLVRAPRGRRAAATIADVDVRVVAGEVVAAARPVAARFGAAVRLELPPGPVRVQADRLRLAQALANLVVNAAEHGGGDVLVRVLVAAPHVRIEIHDGGPGPGASRLAAAARRSSTMGMRGLPAGARGTRGHGLAIAARVVAEHGGRLVVECGFGPETRPAALVLELPRRAPGRSAVAADLPRRREGSAHGNRRAGRAGRRPRALRDAIASATIRGAIARRRQAVRAVRDGGRRAPGRASGRRSGPPPRSGVR
jgi:signal transduction histidine kinase